ncbi:hypothetical protein [Streptomyces sp. NPDC089799]|uniref:hypothetical protein n=1 Tax=Streptomyces sp. NPDC089799 TaxID=3155066 RepID=UPI003418DA72
MDTVRQAVRRGLTGISVALLAVVAVIGLHALDQTRHGGAFVQVIAGVRGDQPVLLVLLRTPVSLFVPARDLSAWPGLPQLFIAFALAQLSLGRTRTVLVAYASTLAGTFSARIMIALGPYWWGLPAETAHVVDTGPSAAIVALFTHVAVVRRAPVLFLVTGGSMILRSIAEPNLAGREHLVAIAVAIALGLFHNRLTGRRRPRPASRGVSFRTRD